MLSLPWPSSSPGWGTKIPQAVQCGRKNKTKQNKKTAMRYHFIPTRIAGIKKSNNNKCWRGVENLKPPYTVGGNVKWCSHFFFLAAPHSMWDLSSPTCGSKALTTGPPGKSHRCSRFGKKSASSSELPYDPAILLLDIYQPREMKTCSHKNLYTNVCSIIPNSRKVETAQMFIN